MLIRCKYCGNVIDIKSRIAVDMYISGIPARCRVCLADLYNEEEENGRGDDNIRGEDKVQ